MDIKEILQLRGVSPTARIKLVRHQDKRFDIHELAREGKLEIYQAYQSEPRFDCDYIISFLGDADRRAVFWGVYKVLGRTAAKTRLTSADQAEYGLAEEGSVFYDFQLVDGFDDLRERLVIDWGKATLAWHQWLSPKEVIEILPKGYVKKFPGYLDFVLRHDQLVELIANPATNREWHRMLAAVAGIYLIVDQTTGKQYVGSAYGRGGILARWTSYATSGHGGNAQLVDLLKGSPEHAKNFTYSILRTLPLTLTPAEVINFEGLYKRKLGSRAFGLNSN